jgi:hypothetical protein
LYGEINEINQSWEFDQTYDSSSATIVDALSKLKNSLLSQNFDNFDHVMVELDSNPEVIEKVFNFT